MADGVCFWVIVKTDIIGKKIRKMFVMTNPLIIVPADYQCVFCRQNGNKE